MFGISFFELIVILLAIIILVKPEEYQELLLFCKKLYREIKQLYQQAVQEVDKLKAQAGLKEIDEQLHQDFHNLEKDLQKITGDDGKEYPAYDVQEVLKNERRKK